MHVISCICYRFDPENLLHCTANACSLNFPVQQISLQFTFLQRNKMNLSIDILYFSSGVVLFLTGEVIYLWSSGDLKKEQELALAILEENLAANETMVSTSTETFLDQ